MRKLRKTCLLLAFFLLSSPLLFAQTSPGIRFAFLTDIHVLPGSESSENLKNVVAEINTLSLDMVIVSGDVSNQGSDEELLHVKSILDELGMPYHIIPGNHETNWSESAGQTFSQLWGNDRFLFQEGDFLFAGINTGPFMRMGDGHVKQQDIRWLQRELDKRMKPGVKLLFFAHYPLAEGLDQWFIITELLKKHSTVAAFCGHGHRLQLLNFDGITGIMGRSMVLRGDHVPGYNIVELTSDSLKVYEKIVSKPTEEASIQFALDEPVPITDKTISPLPDYTVNHEYPQITPVHHFTDSASVFTGPLVLGDTLLVYGNSVGTIKALNIPGGKVQWEIQAHEPIFSTPVLASDKIIAADAEFLYAIESSTGDILWKKPMTSPVVATPLVDGDYLYLGIGKEGMYKIRVSDGETIWAYENIDGLIQSRPALKDDHLVFTAWDTHLYCLDSQTGSLRWKWNNGKTAVLLSPGNVVPVIAHGKIFIVAPDRYMTALDLYTGEQLWRTNRHQVRESMGISADGEKVFAKLMNDSIIAVSTLPASFELLWITDAGFGYDHNPCPILADQNYIYTATRNGVIIALNDQQGELSWKHKIGNSTVNFFFEGDSRYLWLTSADGQIVALPRRE